MSPRPHIAAVTSTQAAPTPMSAAETLDRVAWLWQALADAESVSGTAARVVELVRALTGADACGLLVRDYQGQTSRLAERGPAPEGAGLLGAHDPAGPPPRRRRRAGHRRHPADATWPDWSAVAAGRGVRSARFVGLASLHPRPVVLELYAATARLRRPGPHGRGRGAPQAGVRCARCERVAGLERDRDDRALVGQASGLLMERYHLGADQALALPVRSSARASLDLRDLARELVAAQDRAAARRTSFPGAGAGGERGTEVFRDR